MKIKLLFICLLLILGTSQSEAQFGKKFGGILNKAKKKAERKVEKEVERKIDDTIDDTVEEVMTPKKTEESNKAKETLAEQAKRLEVMLEEGGVDSHYLEEDLKKYEQDLKSYKKKYPKADFSKAETFYTEFSEKYNELVGEKEEAAEDAKDE